MFIYYRPLTYILGFLAGISCLLAVTGGFPGASQDSPSGQPLYMVDAATYTEDFTCGFRGSVHQPSLAWSEHLFTENTGTH